MGLAKTLPYHASDPTPGSDMTHRTDNHRSRRRRRPLLLLLTLVGFMAVASPAAAHLDIVSTDPADGTVMSDPSDGITLTFNKAATPSGKGFTVYNEKGKAVPVEADSSDGGVTWNVQPKAQLERARYGLKWEVAAGDAHPRSGAIIFHVAPQGETSTRTRPSHSSAGPSGSAHTDGSHGGSGSGSGSTADSGAHAGMPGHTSATEGGALEAALASEDDTSWDAAATMARWVSFAGILIAVGALMVVVTTLVGSEGDVRLSERVVRIAATLAAAGAVAEGVYLLWTVGPSVPWEPATAVSLRFVGGATMAISLRLLPRRGGGRRSHDVPTLPDIPSGGRHGGTRTAQLVLPPPVRTGRVRGVPARPLTAVASAVAMLTSFLFDGHTAAVGPWPVIAAAAFTHTAAASVWVGGVVLLATLLLGRARVGVPTGAGELAVRFSVPATAAVVTAGLAGTGLAMLIIDKPGDLLTTPWGRILLIKLGLVTAVAIMGYVNNRYALPALDAWRPGTARLLRRTVAAEATVMIAVLLVTAILVASQA